MLDRFDEAWPIAYEAAARARDQATYPGEIWLAEIASLAGSHCDAARWFRTACDTLEERGQLAYLSTHAPQLGRELCALGRYDEAEPLARRGRELGDEQDVTAQAFSRQVQALVLAHRGDHGTAERLAREALAITEQTDGLNFQGAALGDLAQVLHAAGRDDEAATALAGALDRYERKRNLAMARRVREQLAALQVA
jgi:tetratricopeptide (TPR) repeat protein